MDDRRDLRFERIVEVIPEVERLLAGHRTCGGWTLGQILYHLATAVHLILVPDSSDRDALGDPDLLRTYDVRRRRFFQLGRFPEGRDIPIPALEPPIDADPDREAESLRRAIDRLILAEGPFPPHPLLGPLSKHEWVDFHRIHCAHHLNFTQPV